MKIIGIFFLLLLLSMAYAILADLIVGLKLSMSLRNMISPLWVMTIGEYVILFLFLSLMLVSPIHSLFKKKKQAQQHKKT